jgi:hypothetical protein
VAFASPTDQRYLPFLLTQEKSIYPSISDAARAIDYTKEGISLAFKRQKEKGNDFILVKKKRYMLKIC